GKVVVTWEAGGGLSPPGALAVLDPYSWKPVHQWRLHKGDRGNQFILATSLSPNGKTLNASVGGDGQQALLRWNVATVQPLPALGTPPTRAATALASSPDGRLLAAAEWFDTIRLWETATWQQRAVAPVADNVHVLAFSPDGRFLATANR